MIKKVFIAACLLVTVKIGIAQQHMPKQTYTYSDEGPPTGFSKQNLFVGGSLSLGFGSYSFNVGGTPEIGYSLNNWLDAGVLVNINYNSIRADPNYNGNIRTRSFNYGGGVFARAYPLPFLFLTVQPEYNLINYNQKDMNPGATGTYSQNTNATSLLLGIGYGQRVVGQSGFYIALMFDALTSKYSPYRDYNGAAVPIVRAGFDFYLHQRK
ncbi:hypothetical protein ACX0G9_08650 [Flavitalea flava]